jgi:hypothetical protein
LTPAQQTEVKAVETPKTNRHESAPKKKVDVVALNKTIAKAVGSQVPAKKVAPKKVVTPAKKVAPKKVVTPAKKVAPKKK